MQDTTRTALTAILAADPTVSRPAATRALSILDGADAPHPMGRILRTTEAARLCGVTTKTLRAWSKAGVLVPVYAGQVKENVPPTPYSRHPRYIFMSSPAPAGDLIFRE